MSEAAIFQSSLDQRVFGVTRECVFASPASSSLAKAESIEAGARPKEIFGSDCVTISLEKIKSVQALGNATGTVFVAAKGLADDIRVETGDAELQSRILQAIQAKLGPSFKETRRKSSLWQTAPKLILFSIIIAIMTVGGFMAARQMEAGQYRESTKLGRRGAQERAFGAVLEVLGPTGTLAVGLPLLAGCGAVLWWKAKHRFPVVTLRE